MNKLTLLLITIISFNNLQAQTPLEGEFTYQGKLNDSNGNLHNGDFDFKFTAFDAENDGAGTNLGLVIVDDIEVVDGIFTTTLTFNDIFMGDKIWLEISVREGASTGGYTKLLPRQQVTETPYATHARFVGANAVTDLEILDGSIGTVDLSNDSITAAKIVDNVVGTSEINSSQVQRRIITTCPAGAFIQSVNQDGSAVCVAELTGLTSVTSAEIVDGTIVAIDIDKTQIQKRVGTVCSGGRMMRSINEDGIASCIFPNTGSDTVVSADIVDGTIQAVDVDNTQIQQRITGMCDDGFYLNGINQDGSLICKKLPINLSYIADDIIDASSNSIALGLDNNPIISYFDNDNFDLKIFKCHNTACSNGSSVTLDSIGDVGLSSSIAIGTDNNPIISYSEFDINDFGFGALKLYHCNNIACTSGTATTLDNIKALSTSIAIGSDNNPLISYYDSTNGDLKLYKCSNISCTNGTASILRSSGDIGFGSSIVIRPDNIPIISYIDRDNDNLMIYRCFNTSCTIGASQTLDNSFFLGVQTSIVINSDNNPIISYQNGVNIAIYRCTSIDCTSGNINITSIEDPSIEVIQNSIAIGADGIPVISYSSPTDRDLSFYRCSSNSCFSGSSITLDGQNSNAGVQTSILIGTDNNPIISYIKNGSLKVYNCGNNACN